MSEGEKGWHDKLKKPRKLPEGVSEFRKVPVTWGEKAQALLKKQRKDRMDARKEEIALWDGEKFIEKDKFNLLFLSLNDLIRQGAWEGDVTNNSYKSFLELVNERVLISSNQRDLGRALFDIAATIISKGLYEHYETRCIHWRKVNQLQGVVLEEVIEASENVVSFEKRDAS